MGEKRIIINLIVLLTFLFFFILFKFYNKKDGSTPPISPNILYLTSPVTSFSGKVENIAGTTLFVSNQYDILQTIPVFTTFFPNKPSIIPTPKIKTLTYKVLITEKTQITQPPLNINYLFKTVSPTLPPKLTKKDIKVGQYIYINTQTDLRT
ncbi:MAG: hypothetical protein QXP04_05270, partial [Candidatus Nanoarchaeia archaeon]|nr:hypothetical protein [Candidatus Jingweiarchaeum tengchongense]